MSNVSISNNTVPTTENASGNFEIALKYAKRGWPVFPVKSKGKKPLTKNGFKDATTDQDKIKKWWQKWPNANIGIPTGRDTFIGLDLDVKGDINGEDYARNIYGFEVEGPAVRTGGGGLQAYYNPPSFDVKNSAGDIAEGIDIRGDGGYVVVPPSIHPTGNRYEWIENPNGSLPDMPDWLIKELYALSDDNGGKDKKGSKLDPEVILQGLSVGERNDKLFRYGCRLKKQGLTRSEVRALLETAADHAEGQYPENDDEPIADMVTRIFESYDGVSKGDVAKVDSDDSTIAQKLIHIADQADFYRAYPDRVFAAPPGERALELTQAGGGFRRWLRKEYMKKYDRPARSSDMSDVVQTLAARTQFDGKERTVFQRVAHQDGVIYIDLGHDKPKAMRISRDGVSVVTDPPVAFVGSSVMAPMPEPDTSEGLEPLHDLHDLLNRDSDSSFLIASWMLTAWMPPAPYPVIMLDGPPGAGKSTTAAILRYFVDPAGSDGRLLAKRPRTGGDLAAQTAGVHVLALENLSSLPEWLSDHLAALATGSAHVARKLYTDFGVALLERKTPVILNGINPGGIGGDLRDRMFPVNLSKPKEQKRESDIWKDVEELRPKVIGALALCCSEALKNIDSVDIPPEKLPRMADAAAWCVAAEDALNEVKPWRDKSFLDVLKEQVKDDSESALKNDPVGSALIYYLRHYGDIEEKTSTEIKALLEDSCPQVEDFKREGIWPRGSNVFSRNLSKMQPQFLAAGYICEDPDRRRRRTIKNERGEES
jgi:hypothetical protein